MLHIIDGFIVWFEAKEEEESNTFITTVGDMHVVREDNSADQGEVGLSFNVIVLQCESFSPSCCLEAHAFDLSSYDKPKARMDSSIEYMLSVQKALESLGTAGEVRISTSEEGLMFTLWQLENGHKHQLAKKKDVKRHSDPAQLFTKLFDCIHDRIARSTSTETRLRSVIQSRNQDLLACRNDIVALTEARDRGFDVCMPSLALMFTEKNRKISELEQEARTPLERAAASSRVSSCSSSGSSSHNIGRTTTATNSSHRGGGVGSRNISSTGMALSNDIDNLFSGGLKKTTSTKVKNEAASKKQRKTKDWDSKETVIRQSPMVVPSAQLQSAALSQIAVVPPSYQESESAVSLMQSSNLEAASNSQNPLNTSEMQQTQSTQQSTQPTLKLKRSMYDDSDTD